LRSLPTQNPTRRPSQGFRKGVFQELKDQGYFRQIKVAFGGVMWPHEQDFSPETIEVELREPPIDKAV